MNDQEYDYITRVIRKLTGIDLDNYKSQQMRRRLTGLIASQAGGVPEYCELVKKNKDALKKLRNFLTINVSEFFRDIEQFNILKTKVLPELLSRNPSLKVWSSGCSHGGEPYSIAILLEEIAPGRHHRVLGTDIDDETLARARAGGPYSSADVSNVAAKYLLKYFTRSDDQYYVSDHLKRKVEWKRQNLLSDKFERNFDLIVRRNVVIYFTDEAKDSLYKGFHQSLNPNGNLFIGATETLLNASSLGFERLHNCFYRKLDISTRSSQTTAAASSPAGVRKG